MSDPPLIAIVDDEEAMRDALSELLLVLGYSCRAFERAETFLAAYAPGLFDCLITDIRMPGMGGLGLIQHLRATDSSLPVIVVTSMTDPVARSRALASGAHAYLTKPFSDDALLHSLTTALPDRAIPNNSGEGQPDR